MTILTSVLLGWSTTASAAPREMDIVFVVDGTVEHSQELLDVYRENFKETVDPEKFTVGFPSNSVYAGGYNSKEIIQAVRNAQSNRDAELIVVLGPQSAKRAASTVGGTPILAPRIFDAKLQGIGKNTQQNKSNVRNLFLLDAPYQIKDDIQMMRSLLSFNHLGVVIDEALVEALGVERLEMFYKSTSPNVRRVSIIPIGAKSKGVLSSLGSVQDGAEAIYVASAEQLSPEERAKLLSGLIQLKIPTMTRHGHQDVALGAVMGRAASSNEADRARLTALAGQQILSGTAAASLAIHYNISGTVQVNMGTAISLGVSPAWDVLAEAQIVGVEVLEDEALSLDSAMLIAEDHPMLLAADYGVNASIYEWSEFRAGYLPQLHAFVSGSTIDKDRAQRLLQLEPQVDLSAGVTFSQTLLDVPYLVRMKAKRTELHAKAQDLEALKQDMKEDVALAYLALLHSRVTEQLYRERLVEIRTLRDITRRRSDLDEMALADVAFMDGQTIQVQQKLLETQERSRSLEILFNKVVGLPVHQTVSLSDQDLLTAGLMPQEEGLLTFITDPRTFPTFLNVMREFGLSRSYEGAAAKKRMEALELEYKANKSELFLPTMSFYGNTSYHFLRDDYSPFSSVHQHFGKYNDLITVLRTNSNLMVGGQPLASDIYESTDPSSMDLLDWQVGVQVNYPIFNGLGRQSAYKKSISERDAGMASQDSLEMELDATISESFVRLNSAYRSLKLSLEAKKSVTEGFEAYATQYESGHRSVIELNAASMLAMDAQLEYINNIHTFRSNFVESLSSISALDYYGQEALRAELFEEIQDAYSERGFYIELSDERSE